LSERHALRVRQAAEHRAFAAETGSETGALQTTTKNATFNNIIFSCYVQRAFADEHENRAGDQQQQQSGQRHDDYGTEDARPPGPSGRDVAHATAEVGLTQTVEFGPSEAVLDAHASVLTGANPRRRSRRFLGCGQSVDRYRQRERDETVSISKRDNKK